MSSGLAVTAANFEQEVVQSSIPVLVDFWAEWCQPCRMVGPFLDQLAEEYSGRVKICKVNVDEENELAGRHNVVSIPTMVVYKDGKIVRQQTGAAPKSQIAALFSDLVPSRAG
ncbi:MAG: thioredoxin [Spirochaetaceae bacterium]|nr:thioredoxin [Spirochaetaceae bacterium]